MNKKFDCVLMKRKAAEKIYAIIKNLSVEEELSYWNSSFKKTVNIRHSKRKINLVTHKE